MNMFRRRWEELYNQEPHPKFATKINVMPWDEFESLVYENTEESVKQIADKLHKGEAFLLKGAFDKTFVEEIIDKAHYWAKNVEEGHVLMLDGAKDYHRIIDDESTKKYTYRAIRHSHFFFPWNDDPINMKEEIYEKWRVFKFLGGYDRQIYEKNIPSDGVVDRIQIAHYPSGGGGIAAHVDTFVNQKVIISCLLSKRGVHYEEGGFWAMGKDGKKIDFEPMIDQGDFFICFPSIVHGVDTIDPQKTLDWNSKSGRWFIGLYSNDSNVVENRNSTTHLEIEKETVLTK